MIILENVSLNYPISDKNLSLRRNIIKGIFGSNIKKDYIEALKKINLKLDKGVYGLYGENGTGKTSLLKVVAGIYQPSLGKIEINGSVSSMININFGFNPELSGIENIELRLIVEGVKKDHRKNLIDTLSGLGLDKGSLKNRYDEAPDLGIIFKVKKVFIQTPGPEAGKIIQ